MTILTRDPIALGPLVDQVLGPDRGAVATFLGTVRNHHAGREVVELEYSAYQPMVEALAAELVAEAAARWPVSIVVRHRLGQLAIGEVAVAVVAAGGHRDEAFAACRHLIEEIKRRLPIWKRERYADGSEAWVDPTVAGGIRPAGLSEPIR